MRFDRIRRMTGDEVRWRAGTLIRAGAQRAAASVRPPHWERRDILRAVSPTVRDSIRAPVASQRWQEVHERIADRLTSRPSRFVLDPTTPTPLRQAVLTLDSAAAGDARERADRLVDGRYDLLGYRELRFAHDGHRVDWHFDPVHGRRAPRLFYTRVPYLDPAVGDHKVIWEINRHQHWLALGRAAWLTGDGRYAHAILGELQDWLDANPPLVGINWASMLEIGFRTLSWTWALHCLLGLRGSPLEAADRGPAVRHAGAAPIPGPGPRVGGAEPWLVDMLVALSRQLTHVEQNLSYYFSPNTHLTGEALALYVVGAALPELAGATRWMRTGRRILLEEIDRQILPDGGHAERSMHYQHYTLDFYVLALLTARLTVDDDAAGRFADASARLAEYTRIVADDEGRLPLIGDDDGGMVWPMTGRACSDARGSLAIAAAALKRADLAPWGITEEAIWVAGPRAVAEAAPAAWPTDVPAASRAFMQTGYVVLRDADGDHAVFDTGAHGFQNAGHAHADALAVTLTLARRPLLIDSGTSTYTMDPELRDRLRGSASHNTLTVDGRSQSTPAGPFHWRSRTDARLEAWRRNDAFEIAEAAHDGYAPLQHRRVLARLGHGSWLIADAITGGGRHTAAAHWHVDPAWTLEEEPGRVRAVHASGDVAWLLHDGLGAERFSRDRPSALGWYAPVYGTLVPAPALRVAVEGVTPLRLITWVGADPAWRTPTLVRLPPDGEPARSPIAAEIVDGDRRALFVVHLGNTPPGAAPFCRLGAQETDARFLHRLAEGDRLVRLDLVDVRRVVSERRAWLSIDAEEPFADLHIGIDRDDVIDLRASTPAGTLRLHGVSPPHRVRLNGREFPSTPAGPAASTLLIHPIDWRVGAHDRLDCSLGSGAAFARP